MKMTYALKNFKKKVLFVGLVTLFWTSGDICPGFQSQGGCLLIMHAFLTCVILRFTSGVTPADCTEVSMVAEPFEPVLIEVSTSIGGGSGLEPTTLCAASTVLCTARPLRLFLQRS